VLKRAQGKTVKQEEEKMVPSRASQIQSQVGEIEMKH